MIDADSLVFFPRDPKNALYQVTSDGDALGTVPTNSYGELVEWAWIKAESEQALGRIPDWNQLDAYARYAQLLGSF